MKLQSESESYIFAISIYTLDIGFLGLKTNHQHQRHEKLITYHHHFDWGTVYAHQIIYFHFCSLPQCFSQWSLFSCDRAQYGPIKFHSRINPAKRCILGCIRVYPVQTVVFFSMNLTWVCNVCQNNVKYLLRFS